MWAPPHGSTPPVESRKGVQKAHSSSYSSPSRWRFTSDAHTRTWYNVPHRTTLLAFADDMAVVTATSCQPLSTTPGPTRATKVLHAVTKYVEGKQLLVHNIKCATMVHNAPPPPLRTGDPPRNPVNTATCLGVQQAATANGVTLPPDLIRQLTRTLVIARIVALSGQALAYFLQAVLNAAIGFQALHLTHPQHMLQAAATTVR